MIDAKMRLNMMADYGAKRFPNRFIRRPIGGRGAIRKLRNAAVRGRASRVDQARTAADRQV